MIQGYPDQPSVLPGGTLTLHISTDSPQFRVDFYRQGQTLDFKQSSGWLAGKNIPGGQPNQDWGWPNYDFPVPADWTSGVYIAMFVQVDVNGNVINPPDPSTADARDSKALFVVKSSAPGSYATILYKLPFFMYQAYNKEGGWSLYQGAPVTIRRPGGGTGGTPWDTFNWDPFDSTPRQTFVHWDVPFISWLEGNGYRVDYCTDLDIHEDTNLELLSPYALLLSVGHDEYWSDAMRNNVEAFIANGGNVGFFSGNTCWWRVSFDDPITFRRTANWYDPAGPNEPENILTGVSFRNGGERDTNTRPIPVGFRVQHADYWVYQGSGLNDGDTFGAGQNEYIVGYECDGAEFDRNDLNKGIPVHPTGNDGTPLNFAILGVGDVSAWGGRGNKAATMGMYTSIGTIFTAATTDWARVLGSIKELHVVQITRNVINRLGGGPKGLATLSNLGSIVAVSGFFSPDDNYRHAIVATSDGNVSEIFYNPQAGQGQTVLSNLGSITDIGAFFTNDDNYRHAIVATADGNIHEIFYNPQAGQGQAQLGSFSGIVAVDGFFSTDDNYRHAIVATADGNIHEIFYNPQAGQGQAQLGSFSGIVDIGAFYSSDDKYRHAIVATTDGNVYELYYNPQFGQGQALLGNFPGITKISAFYATDDAYFSRRVIVATSDGRISEIKYSPRGGIMRSLLWNTRRMTDVGGFYSSDDNYRHVIISTTSGDVQELFYASEGA